MAPSYQSLPAELLSRVAELVHEQDLAFVQRDSARREISDVYGRHRGVSQGEWSYWYVRGIKAMVQVDQATRTVAVPFLYKSITAKQTDSFWFRYEVLGEDLAVHVRHLDTGDNGTQHSTAVACALRKLPNMSSLNVSGFGFTRRFDGGGAPHNEEAALHRVLRDKLGTVASLETPALSSSALCHILRCVRASTLRKVRLTGAAWSAKSGRSSLGEVLEGLGGLVELEMACVRDALNELRQDVRLPSVRSLVLEVEDLNYEEGLLAAHDMAPSITRLTIRNLVSPSAYAVELPSPLLPTLVSLVIETETYLPAFHQLPLPSLEHFFLSINDECDEFPFDDEDTPFDKAPLRSITLSFRGYDSSEYRRDLFTWKCDERAIHLTVKEAPLLVDHLKTPIVDNLTDSRLVVDKCKLDTLDDTLDWARRRASWLYKVDDGSGLHELAHATVRLHQLRLIDGS